MFKKQIQKLPYNKAGMTLVEVAVAVAIISVVLVFALAGVISIARVGDKSHRMETADKEMGQWIADGNLTAASAVKTNNLSFTLKDQDGNIVEVTKDGVTTTFGVTIPGFAVTYKFDGKSLIVFERAP